MNVALLSLCLAAFTIGTTELVIAGLLPNLAGDLAIPVPTAGLLVTGYAIGVAVGGPILSLLVPRLPRKPLLIGLMSVFALAHLVCAVATDFPILMAARVIAATTQGTFFGVAALVAVGLVTEDRRGAALSVLFGGLTLAALLGVPLGTAIGNALGWRATFVAIGVLAAAACALMALCLPPRGDAVTGGAGLADQFRALANRDVVVAYAIITTMFVGLIGTFAYVSPMLTIRAGLSGEVVPLALVAFGVGATIGMYLGGRLADRAPAATLRWAFPAQFVVFALMIVLGSSSAAMVALLFLLGLLFYVVPSTIQNRVIQGAGDAPEFASTLISTVANLGIAIGAAAGSLILSSGGGYGHLPILGVASASLSYLLATFASGPRKFVEQPAPNGTHT